MDNKELYDKIERLEKENSDLKAWQGSVNQLLNQIIEMVSNSGNKQSGMDVEKEIRALWLYAIRTGRSGLQVFFL